MANHLPPGCTPGLAQEARYYRGVMGHSGGVPPGGVAAQAQVMIRPFYFVMRNAFSLV